MGLVIERVGTTTDSLKSKPRICFTCKQRKTGLFGLSPNGDPMCGDCLRAIGRPID